MIPYCNVSISIVCKMAFNSIEYPTVAILQYSTYNGVEFYEMYPGDQENDIFLQDCGKIDSRIYVWLY